MNDGRKKDASFDLFLTIAACLWMGAFPLLQGGTYARITRDKWYIMVFLSGITLLCLLADLFREGRREKNAFGAVLCRRFLNKQTQLPLLLGCILLGWMLVCCLCGPYGAETWLIGASVRREGWLTQVCYIGLMMCFIGSGVREKPVIMAAAGGVVVFFVIVMLQRFGGNPLNLYPRGTSYALNPEFQGTIGNIDMDNGYLCIMAALFLFSGLKYGRKKTAGESGKRADKRILVISAALGFVLCCWMILTMNVQFGIMTLTVLLAAAGIGFLPNKRRIQVLLLLTVLVCLLIWFWPGTEEGALWELHELVHGRGRLSFGSNRLGVWKYSLKLAEERPFLGGGTDTFVYRFNIYLEEHGLSLPTEQNGVPLQVYFDNPHNEYIAQLVNHGLPGTLLFIGLILTALRREKKGNAPLLTACSASVFGYALQAFFSFSVCMTAPMFWVMAGMSAGGTKGEGLL